MAKYSLAGSERQPMSGAHSTGAADPGERLEVSVLVRRRASEAFAAKVTQFAAGGGEPHLQREAFARQFGADADDFAKVKSFASEHGLAVVQEDAARRTIVLSGTVCAIQSRVRCRPRTVRARRGNLSRKDRRHSVTRRAQGHCGRRARARQSTAGQAALSRSRRPRCGDAPRGGKCFGLVHADAASATLYDFPAGNGSGQCIAIVELGGGYRPADLQTYFSKLGITAPSVTTVSVDHAKNSPTGSANGPDGEVMLDIEVAGAIAPGAKIVVYFAPNTDAGFLDAITTAAHDPVNKPSVISISWGGPESTWTAQAMTAYDEEIQERSPLRGRSPYALRPDVDGGSMRRRHEMAAITLTSRRRALTHSGCGGTSVHASNGKISTQVVWNDGASGGAGGGGMSGFFALPAWQKGLKVSNGKGAATALTKRGVSSTSPAMPIRRPVTRFASMARTWYTAAPVQWRRCGRGCLPASTPSRAVRSAISTQKSTHTPTPLAMLHKATTEALQPLRDGMRAPALAVRSAPS